MHDDNFIRVLNGGEPVRDHDCRPSFHQFFQRLGDHALGFGVDAGRGLVEHEDGGIICERPRKGEELPLSGGKRAAALGDGFAVAARHFPDKGIGIYNLCRPPDILRRNSFIIQGNIAADIPRKDEHILLYLSDRAAQHIRADLTDTDTVYQDLPFLNIIIPPDQVQDGGFSSPGFTDKCDFFARLNDKADVF